MQRILTIAVVALGAIGLLGAPAIASHGSSDGGPTLNDIVVNKVVTGDVPAGTEFKVYIDCVRASGGEEGTETQSHGGPGTQLTEAEILFAADGTPKTLNSITVGPGAVACQVTETLAGGAESTDYACEITNEGSPAPEEGPGEAADGQGASCALGGDAPVTVTFRGVRDATGTVTVTNHFPEAQAGAVELEPNFTG